MRDNRCGSTIDQIERAARESGAAAEFRGGVTPRQLRREVLLVDDDVTFVETFGALLRLHGYDVIAEFTLPAALR